MLKRTKTKCHPFLWTIQSPSPVLTLRDRSKLHAPIFSGCTKRIRTSTSTTEKFKSRATGSARIWPLCLDAMFSGGGEPGTCSRMDFPILEPVEYHFLQPYLKLLYFLTKSNALKLYIAPGPTELSLVWGLSIHLDESSYYITATT